MDFGCPSASAQRLHMSHVTCHMFICYVYGSSCTHHITMSSSEQSCVVPCGAMLSMIFRRQPSGTTCSSSSRRRDPGTHACTHRRATRTKPVETSIVASSKGPGFRASGQQGSGQLPWRNLQQWPPTPLAAASSSGANSWYQLLLHDDKCCYPARRLKFVFVTLCCVFRNMRCGFLCKNGGVSFADRDEHLV